MPPLFHALKLDEQDGPESKKARFSPRLPIFISCTYDQIKNIIICDREAVIRVITVANMIYA